MLKQLKTTLYSLRMNTVVLEQYSSDILSSGDGTEESNQKDNFSLSLIR